MNSESIKLALDIFDEAIELDPSARSEFVDRRCKNDSFLLAEVHSLLNWDGQLSIGSKQSDDPPFTWPAEIQSSKRYQFEGEIARGGMGIILRAADRVLKRNVAIKVLLEEHRNQAGILRRFFAEARIGARLQHPGIAPVYDLGCLPDYGPFFAMKLVGGQTLASILANRQQTDSDLSHLLAIFEQLCQTVSFVHSHEIIHRDLKPANVMVGEYGEVQLMDWGLAKNLRNRGESDLRQLATGQPAAMESSIETAETQFEIDATPPTRFGLVMGTPGYMPPEQAAGLQDKTTDVFSLGAILCEILTGKPPYESTTPIETMDQALCENTDAAIARLDRCGCDKQLASVAKKCMATYSLDRYPDAGHVARAITSFRESTAARLHQAELDMLQAKTVASEERKRRRVSVALAISIVVLGLSAMTGWWWTSSRTARHALELAKTESNAATRAESHAYRAAMAAAFLEVENKRLGRALDLLEDAPERFRKWEWYYLRSFVEQSQRIYRNDVNDVELIGLVRGTDYLRFVDSKSTARLINRWTGEELSHQSLGAGRPLGLGPEGKLVLSQLDNAVLWDAETGNVLQRFAVEAGAAIRGVAIATGGTHVAILSEARTLNLFETHSGRLAKAFPDCHCNPVFGAEGETLVWAANHLIRFWNVAENREMRTPIECASAILSVTLTRDGSQLAARFADRVQIWDLQTGKNQVVHATVEIRHIQFNDVGSRLAMILMDGAIRLWDPVTAELMAEFRSPDKASAWKSEISFDDQAFCTLLAEPSHAHPQHVDFLLKGIRLWNEKGAGARILKGHGSFVYPVVLSPDGKRIASGSWDGTVRLWELESGYPVAVLNPHEGSVLSLVFDSTGERLIAGTVTGCVIAWSMATGDVLARTQLSDKCYSLAFTDNDTRLVAGHGGLTVLDGGTLQPLQNLVRQLTPGDEDHLTEVVMGPDAGSFATCSGKSSWARRNEVTLWDANTFTKQRSLNAPYLVASLSYSRDGNRLALGHVNGTITLWDLKNLDQPVLRIEAHREDVLSLQFLSETRLASAGRDKKIVIWDCETGQQMGVLSGHEDYVYSMALSPDGQRLVSGSGDGTVRIWETSPLADRLDAIRKADSFLKPAEILVSRLLADEDDVDRVVKQLQGNQTLSEGLRRAALIGLLRHSIRQRRKKGVSDGLE